MSFIILLKLYILELACVADRDTIIINMHVTLGFTLLVVFASTQFIDSMEIFLIVCMTASVVTLVCVSALPESPLVLDIQGDSDSTASALNNLIQRTKQSHVKVMLRSKSMHSPYVHANF